MSIKDQNSLQLLKDFNNSEVSYPKLSTVLDIFLEQVISVPNNVAVIYNNKQLTYKELDHLSNQFANYLEDIKNVNKGDFIGLMLERSDWLIVTILGILKTGSVYVPIDLEYPEKRKAYIKKDSSCKIIVDATVLNHFKTTRENFAQSRSKNMGLKPTDLIYIIYTSGTTGNPKGVMIQHKSVVNLIYSQTQCFKIDESERILQFSNYCFDASVEQIFLALHNGATLVIIDKEQLKNHQLPAFIDSHKITHLHATPSYLETLSDTIFKSKSLKRVIAGGETCSLHLAQKLGKYFDFYNEYGPTETTVTSTIYKYKPETENQNTLSIGKPIGNTRVYILSKNNDLLPIGEVGELWLAGDGVAKGYLNLPELTSQKFVANPFETDQRMYNTGDYAKWQEDGNLYYVGRKDDQVKIRGYRIELGEIEVALNTLPEIKRAVVVANTSIESEKRLVAYIQIEGEHSDINALRTQLSQSIPEYMVPSIFMVLKDFPLTSNGKIDKKNLPEPINARPTSAPILKKPRTETEKNSVAIWKEILCIPNIGIEDNFFEMGGNSLLVQKLSILLKERFNLDVPVTKIYQYPTIASLSEFLNPHKPKPKKEKVLKKKNKKSTGDIAVIGMAGRFPGASTIEELWNVLEEGRETISFFTPEELDKSIPEALRNDPLYVAARGIVPSAMEFDARFFGLNPKLAEAMDPQQRLFLEITWEVLEQTGYLPRHYDGSIGVYAGSGTNSYYLNNVLPNEDFLKVIGPFQLTTVNDKDYIASRVAYHLNLKGPAVSVHSACSTSLLAIAEATEAIRSGQCDVALAGGSSITSPMYSGHLYQEGSMLSSDGHCRSFDAEGKGTIFSDGAGVVLLKSLEDAIRDGDKIHGVIKGVGLNNDGGNKGSFTAPSVEGEAGAIIGALNDANIDPSKITYIETHGTATPLGDPIEMEGLNMAFGKQPLNRYCALGSIKSNMGHLTAAAGVAGFIKAILAMKNQMIPASLGFENPNPAIDFQNSPFYVNDKLSNWDVEEPRIAGVSSFGVGGTNVHVVLEEFKNKQITSSASRPLQLFTWSAKTETSRYAYKNALAQYFTTHKDASLADAAYSLTVTRDLFNHRSFTIADNKANAIGNLLSEDNKTIKTKSLKVVPSELAFLFPGQGAQYLQMGKSLYDNEDVFRQAVDQCDKILQDDFNLGIKHIIYPDNNSEDAQNKIKDTKFTQPALFVIEYALSQLYMSWGIQPTLLCGHSIGEFVAAHLAGIFSLKDALRLVAVRGKLVSELPGGSMLSVRTAADELTKILPDALSIAAINSDTLCVVSGEDTDIEEFARQLKVQNIANKILLTSHAFHSSMMDPVLEDFEKELKAISINVPRIPMVSTVTATWLTDAEATSTEYWTNHLRAAVNFSGAMDTVIALEDAILLEVGPGRALTTLSQQKKSKTTTSISSLTIPKNDENSYHTVLSALGQLWINGIEPDWHAFYKNETRQKIALPSYVFDRKRCWAEPQVNNAIVTDIETATFNEEIIEEQIIPQTNVNTKVMRKTSILNKISDIILNTSGIELEPSEHELSFLELGLDSLVLTQMAITFKNEFNVPVTFRELNDEFGTPNLLANYLDEKLPADRFADATTSVPAVASNSMAQAGQVPKPKYNGSGNQNSALDLMSQQIQLLGQQIQILQSNGVAPPQVNTQLHNSLVKATTTDSLDKLSDDEVKEHKKPFGASPRIEKQATGLDDKQNEFLKNLIASYNKKTAESKAYTQRHRPHMSDPRVVSGFKPLTKELVYPLVIEKSSGNRLWDLDGNEYIDVLNGFGSCLFGHQPDFIKEALHKQVELGFEVGPQHPLAGEVCELLCEMTGHDRAALCNTGSEAVLGAMRIARTVTGRSLIVAFSSSYHGINDEVIVRGSRMKKTFPAAPGIMPEAVQNMLILDYGTEESLKIIKERAHELAAVLVEPVQSRRPEFQPVEFLKAVREITKASNTTLIFDEIITGFRSHPRGIQGKYNIKADVATYGKVIGGGISIGAIVGSTKYMDALDGGFWNFGDDSYPEVGVTYFAGTFVRHPLALATCKAALMHLKEQGPKLQDGLNTMTEQLAHELNMIFKRRSLPLEINHFSSLWRLKVLEDIPYAELIFVLMRSKGFHIWDGFPCYMTTAFTGEDIEKLIVAFVECIDELSAVGIFNPSESSVTKKLKTSTELNIPPITGARLGIDETGNPAWFINDEKNAGEYIRIEL